MPRFSHSSRLWDARGAGTPQMSDPSDRVTCSERSVSGTPLQRGLGVGLDDHNPWALPALGVDHESALHDAGLEPGGSLQDNADLHLVTPRCSMRNSAWPVNERSQFHQSGKVGIEAWGGRIVAPRLTLTSAAKPAAKARELFTRWQVMH
jgi:hypothetical protein